MTKSKFLTLFKERGYFHQCTDMESLDNLLFEAEQSGEGVTAYIGFDCTAASLHVGSLMQIMILRWLKECGHNPIILLGGATTKIGDPSGKDESRPVLGDNEIAKNMAGIAGVFKQFGLETAAMVNNDDWISKFSLIDFLRNVGRHFSVNRMLAFDSVKTRLEREAEMNFVEFTYMMMQAYDFVELYKIYGCRLQIGGSDQWGNIVNGVELQRRKWSNHLRKYYAQVDYKEYDEKNKFGKDIIDEVIFKRDIKFAEPLAKIVNDNPSKKEECDSKIINRTSIFGLTTPLVTTSSGAKMGKTAAGAVWLSADMLSPYDYWQFWRNTEDKDVWKFMRLFTEISIEEIAHMEATMQGAAINEAKIMLANAATTICHGEDAAKHAEGTARKTFEQGGFGDDLPVVEIARSELEAGIRATEILQRAKLVESGGEAKNLIKGGGVKINDIKISDVAHSINSSDLNSEGVIKLSAGKKKHALVRLV